jgi:alkylhydroperoxidase family enzyme
LQGTDQTTATALARGDLETCQLTTAELGLLKYAEKLTLHAHQLTAADSQHLRDIGWNDQQIAETVYVVSLFAMFNRVADAFGLSDPGYAHQPTETCSDQESQPPPKQPIPASKYE